MKSIVKFCAIALLVFASCKSEKATNEATKKNEAAKEVLAFDSYGEKISADNALSSEEMLAKFNTLKAGDTINVKFTSNIKEVCSKKGCWMKLTLNAENETMVRFKDYGFFMPLDANDGEVIVAGKAFLTETSVKDLQHYAEDAGKSAEEIAKITTSKKEYAFVANGVLMKK